MSCLIIDDEPHCRGALEILMRSEFPEIPISASCKNGKEGLDAISKFHPDFIFLDISMPGMNGFQMLEQLEEITFEVIFTTAFDQYAIKAFKVDALDYLLKPIDKIEFIEAVKKVQIKSDSKRSIQQNSRTNYQNIYTALHNIAVPTLSGLRMVSKESICYLESSGNYTNIYLTNGEIILVSKTLKETTEHLDSRHFVRIHRSYVINLNHLKEYTKGEGGFVTLENDVRLDVSRRKKEDLLKVLMRKH